VSVSFAKLFKLQKDSEKGTLPLSSKDAKKEIEYLSAFQEKYAKADSISPNGLGATLMTEPLEYSGVHVLHARQRKEIHNVLVMDIETWGFRSEMLHLGYLYNPAHPTQPYQKFRSWNAPEKHEYFSRGEKSGQLKDCKVDYSQPGLVNLIEKHLLGMPSDPNHSFKDVIYAHNGEKFDFVGLAYHLTSNTEFDTEFIGDDDLKQFATEEDSKPLAGVKPKMLSMHPDVKPFLKRMLFESGSAGKSGEITRKVPWAEMGISRPSSAKGSRSKHAKITWRLFKAGSKSVIEVTHSRNKVWLVDSLWHLNVPLRSLGAKGGTPLQYTDPEAWIEQEKKAGRIDENALDDMSLDAADQFVTKYWYDHVDPEAEEYCKQDCKVLYDALMRYRAMYGEHVKDPKTKLPLDPLTYITSAQSGLAAMVILSNKTPDSVRYRPGGREEAKYHVVHRAMGREGSWRVCQSKEELLQHYMICTPQKTTFIKSGDDAVIPGGFYQYGKTNAHYKHVVFGGRTEIFKPRNRKGTRVATIDANSMYPSMMFDLNLQYPDPRYLRALSQNLVGRTEILEHLQEHGGMYRVQMSPAENSLVADRFPVFPVRMEGLDVDARLTFPGWKDRLDIYVTGEELKYFLQVTTVKNDDITVVGEDSLFSSLIRSDEAPFHVFAGAFYSERKKAKDRSSKARGLMEKAIEAGDLVAEERHRDELVWADADSLISKLIMNSGGYGVNIQVNDQKLTLTEGDHEGNTKTLLRMSAMSKDWVEWSKLSGITDLKQLESTDIKIIDLARQWSADHYRTSSPRDLHRDGMGTIKRLMVSLPSRLASHSLRAFGASITAHARVSLHKAISGIDQVRISSSETQTSIRSFDVLYCDTDSVHFEVPEDMTDERVAELLSKIRIPGEKGDMVSAIKLGDLLGEWKIETQDPNPALLTDRVKNHIEEKNISPKVLDAFYLAPKHYYFTTKPDTAGRRHLIKDVVKGVPSNASMMRVAMYEFKIQSTKLGDPFGLAMERQMSRDLAPGITNHKSGKRRSYDKNHGLSKPIYLRKPSYIPDGASHLEVMTIIQKEALESASAEGIIKCFEEYETCYCDFERVDALRDRVKAAYTRVTRYLSDTSEAGDDSAYKEYNRTIKLLKESGIIDSKVVYTDEIVL